MTTQLLSAKIGLEHSSVEAIQEVLARYPQIKSAVVYGSRAMGRFKLGSDIDLTLLAPELNLTDLLHIENELDELNLPYKIDLSLHHQIENAELLEHIARVGIEFFMSP